MTKAGVSGGCGFRFCSGCLIPWVGERSAYLGGRRQHKQACKHNFELCKTCNRKEHYAETCAEYLARLKPIADAEDHKNVSAPGEKHWETSYGAMNRFEMSETYIEREAAKKVRKNAPSPKKELGKAEVESRKRESSPKENGSARVKSAKKVNVEK